MIAAEPHATASRLARWGHLLLGACLFAIYLPTLARGSTFSDGPELVTAVHTLGVAHPTGYPIFILVGHAFCKLLALPILTVVKVEIMNALCAAGAAVLTARTARELARLVGDRAGGAEPLDADAAGIAAGALLGVAPLVWEEVHIPEVYPLHLLLVAWAGYLWIRFEVTGRAGYVIAAALPMGLGLAHHVTMVYMLPTALVYLLVRRPSFFVSWAFPAACLVGFLPLLSYGFLLWANSHTTGVPWGDVNGWENLYNHVTGKQYQGFLHNLDRAAHLGRLWKIPVVFDGQFLPEGTALFLVGIVSAFRRAWRPALFHLVYLILNCAHGVHYGVGDYGTYFIPGVYSCAVFIGLGLAALMRFARARREASRAVWGFGMLAVMLAGASASVIGYAHFHRLPASFARHPLPLAIPLAVLAAASAAAAVHAGRKPGRPRPIPATALPALLFGALLVTLIPISAARAHDLMSKPLVGESFGAELADHIPPLSVLMTQGDSVLFTMWYETHVRGRAVDVAVVDVTNVKTPWFSRYVRAHHPWVSMGLIGNRRPYLAGASPRPIVRGADPRCADTAFHDQHGGKECRCWGYGKSAAEREGMLEEDCVESAEEGGVVPREPLEIHAQRMIEDMLDERPVFERNVFTQSSRGQANPRGWDGPSHQRISAEYALVNRGRYNQIVHWKDIEAHDACGETYRPLPLRALEPPRMRPQGQDRRRAYVPNPRPTLLHASYLMRTPEGNDDDATRDFVRQDAIYARVEWFEKFSWDAAKPDKRGQPIRHGVRACVFDPEGRRIAKKSVVSGAREPLLLVEAGALEKVGTYHVTACTLGEIGDAPIDEDARCAWTVLDYELNVR